MKFLKKVYLLHFVYEFEDGHEDVILLGVFSSRKKARAALLRLENNFELKFIRNQFVIDENSIDRISWEEGYITIRD